MVIAVVVVTMTVVVVVIAALVVRERVGWRHKHGVPKSM